MKTCSISIAVTIALVASSLIAELPAQPLQSVKVIAVIDGDTIAILEDKKRVRVRLEGIDAPETKQAFSTKAKERLSELMDSGDVSARVTGTDRYGRMLARLYVTSPRCTIDVNAALVREGLAWHYKTYSDDVSLAEFETLARRERRGLWADAMPVAPWDYRKRSPMNTKEK